MCTWKENPDLMTRLIAAQNSPAHADQDILTFAAFCDDRAELLAHVEHCERRAATTPAKRVALASHAGA